MKTYVQLWFLAEFSLIVRNVSDKFVEDIKTRILFSMTIFGISYRLWDNVEKCCWAGEVTNDSTARRTQTAWWVTKATETHSEYVILNAIQWQKWLRERELELRYTYIPCQQFSRKIFLWMSKDDVCFVFC